ncbi:hypothetical protein JCM11641_002299 [Rhodosporidiobolus odoratus]
MVKYRSRPYVMSPYPSRLPALVVSSSSLLLASGLGICLHVWTSNLNRELAADSDGVDMDESTVVAWWAGEAALRWSLLSAGGSFCGVLGLLLSNSRLHRVFAITTAVDLLATVFLTLVLALLTLTPVLSQPFSAFLCSSTFASDFSGSPTSLLSAHREREGLTWSDGVELIFWGVETCEDSWRVGMVRVILGCIVACALRVYGTWLSWDMNGELREKELRDQGEAWVDQEMCEVVDQVHKSSSAVEEPHNRPRSNSTSSLRAARRGNTLPLYVSTSEAGNSKRPRSHTVSHSAYDQHTRRHPQLVLVPCILDEHGNPVYSPSSPSFALPPYPSPPRQRSNTHNATTSVSPRSTSRSSSRSSHSPLSTRSRSSFSTVTRPIISPPLMTLTDEPEEMVSSPPLAPTASSTGAISGADERANRRARSRSESESAPRP